MLWDQGLPALLGMSSLFPADHEGTFLGLEPACGDLGFGFPGTAREAGWQREGKGGGAHRPP